MLVLYVGKTVLEHFKDIASLMWVTSYLSASDH